MWRRAMLAMILALAAGCGGEPADPHITIRVKAGDDWATAGMTPGQVKAARKDHDAVHCDGERLAGEIELGLATQAAMLKWDDRPYHDLLHSYGRRSKADGWASAAAWCRPRIEGKPAAEFRAERVRPHGQTPPAGEKPARS